MIDGVDAPLPTASRCVKKRTHAACVQGIRGASMDNVSIIGIDISKRSFQLHELVKIPDVPGHDR